MALLGVPHHSVCGFGVLSIKCTRLLSEFMQEFLRRRRVYNGSRETTAYVINVEGQNSMRVYLGPRVNWVGEVWVLGPRGGVPVFFQ